MRSYFIKSLNMFFWLLSLVSLISTLPIILFLLMPKVVALAKIVLLLPDPRFILMASFISVGIYAINANMHLNISSILKKYFKTKNYILNIGLSLLTSYFFWNGFSLFNRFGLAMYLLLSIVMFFFYIFYFEALEDGYGRLCASLSLLSKLDKKRFVSEHRIAIFIAITSMIVVAFLAIFLYSQLRAPIQNRLEAMIKDEIVNDRTPHILDIQPYVTYHMTKVVLKGDNFGWLNRPTDIKSRLLLNHKQKVTVDLWTDTEIIFTIPIDWKLGENSISIEKYIEYDGRFFKSKSNDAKFVLISSTDGWGYDDDLYFEQLKALDKEVLRINGYD